MSAPTAPRTLPSPLSRLPSADREQAIAAIYRALGVEDATHVLAALAGTPQEVWALPDALQDRVLRAILDAFPSGHGAVIVSRLSIARVGTETWLPALRARYAGKGVDAVAREIERDLGHLTADEGQAPSSR